jgi:hypothetical protein
MQGVFQAAFQEGRRSNKELLQQVPKEWKLGLKKGGSSVLTLNKLFLSKKLPKEAK